jgi:predicted transcriptional regulator
MTYPFRHTKEKESVFVGNKTVHKHHVLPKEVGEILRSLPLKERRAYATKLSEAGWTLQSIANELGLTREAIRLYAKFDSNNETGVQLVIKHLPIPPIPHVEVYKQQIKRVAIDPDVLTRLQELHDKARQVRSSSPKYREEAEEFMALVKQLVDSGVTTYRVASSLGITPAAINSRLVRYGYRQTDGKSGAYRQLTNRKLKEE